MPIFKKSYRVLLHGQNFLLSTDEGPRRLGFYATRFVKARSPDRAEEIAVDLVRDDPTLGEAVLNPRDDPPMISATEIQEVGELQRATGFTFYPEEGTEVR